MIISFHMQRRGSSQHPGVAFWQRPAWPAELLWRVSRRRPWQRPAVQQKRRSSSAKHQKLLPAHPLKVITLRGNLAASPQHCKVCVSIILSRVHRSIEGCCVPGGKDAGPKKASAAAQDDGADSDEDWSRGGKASKGKKGGKAKKSVRPHTPGMSECPVSSQARVHPCDGDCFTWARRVVQQRSSHACFQSWKQCDQSEFSS